MTTARWPLLMLSPVAERVPPAAREEPEERQRDQYVANPEREREPNYERTTDDRHQNER